MVDDEPEWSSMVGRALGGGYEVQGMSPDDALRAMDDPSFKPDAVLVDLFFLGSFLDGARLAMEFVRRGFQTAVLSTMPSLSPPGLPVVSKADLFRIRPMIDALVAVEA